MQTTAFRNNRILHYLNLLAKQLEFVLLLAADDSKIYFILGMRESNHVHYTTNTQTEHVSPSSPKLLPELQKSLLINIQFPGVFFQDVSKNQSHTARSIFCVGKAQ